MVVYFRAYRIPAGTVVQPHRHAWWQFAYAREGIIHVTLSHSTIVLPPQYGMWIPANVRHTVLAADDVALESLYIRSIPDGVAAADGRVVVVTDLVREFIHYACRKIGRRYDEAGPDGIKVRVLLDLLGELPDAPLSLPLPADEKLLEMCNAIQRLPERPHSLTGWAGELNMSSRTLARHFARETGMTFLAWKQRLRLLQSLGLLKKGHSITRIALDLGYSSASAYIYAFRKLFGAPPNRFRAGDQPPE
ncbi:AraC family transcriptional regulator [Cupriavidus sp. 30B13]|uniref:AraC family transcriptional regulator n=1 Tax=Cupriavidus sp. 30B13 TaxID=3384241 RepID=UPI003B91C7FA